MDPLRAVIMKEDLACIIQMFQDRNRQAASPSVISPTTVVVCELWGALGQCPAGGEMLAEFDCQGSVCEEILSVCVCVCVCVCVWS